MQLGSTVCSRSQGTVVQREISVRTKCSIDISVEIPIVEKSKLPKREAGISYESEENGGETREDEMAEGDEESRKNTDQNMQAVGAAYKVLF